MLKRIIALILVAVSVIGLAACSKKEDPNTIKVGTIAGPETQLMQVAAKVAKQRYGLNVKIITFSDYSMPNKALSDGTIQANAFQHVPFMLSEIKNHGYQIASVGKTFLYPMGLYSNKITKLSELKNGAKVAIPNDPSNEARALLLLQQAQLIKINKKVGINATPTSIIDNPKKLQFIELDAAELPRALGDVDLAAINTNYAKVAKLNPSKALFKESTNSPYTNVIAVRVDQINNPKILDLVKAFQSPAVRHKALQLFGPAAIAAWTPHTTMHVVQSKPAAASAQKASQTVSK